MTKSTTQLSETVGGEIRDEHLRVSVFGHGMNGLAGLPLGYCGDPGSGKTEMLTQFCEHWQFPYYVLSPAEQGEGGFGVTPVYDEKTGALRYPPPHWITSKFPKGEGVLIIDEASCAKPILQAPVQALIHRRMLGDTFLGKGVRVLLAYNPPEMAAGGWDFAASMANRFGHLDVRGINVEKLTAYFEEGLDRPMPKEDYAVEERRVAQLWPEHFGNARALVASFLRSSPDACYQPPKARDPKASKAWPSPRTWELTMRSMASCACQGVDPDVHETMTSAYVGVGMATKFLAYAENMALPSVPAWLKGAEKYNHDKSRLDRTMAFLTSASLYISDANRKLDQKKREAEAVVLWELMDELFQSVPQDILISPTRTMVKARLSMVKEARKVTHAILPLLYAANIDESVAPGSAA